MLNRHQRKRQFIEYVLKHHVHQEQGVQFLLTFLMTQPDFIQYIEFTDQVEFTPRGIYISYETHTAVPFLYYKNTKAYASYEQAFHDLRLNALFHPELFFIELNIPHYFELLVQFDVFYEHDFAPIDPKIVKQVESELQMVAQSAEKMRLKSEIDEALDAHDFNLVKALIDQLEALGGTTHEI